jgi:hypothetical protein
MYKGTVSLRTVRMVATTHVLSLTKHSKAICCLCVQKLMNLMKVSALAQIDVSSSQRGLLQGRSRSATATSAAAGAQSTTATAAAAA